MLPEFSTEISVRNFGKNFTNEIVFLKKEPKSAFSRARFDREGGAPGQKLFFEVIPIG